MTAGELADLITHSLRFACTEGLQDILVNVTAMTGFESPGPAYRRWIARRWAAAVECALRVVIVARPEHICPEHSGLLAAAEEGLDAHICATEVEAVAWLDAACP